MIRDPIVARSVDQAGSRGLGQDDISLNNWLTYCAILPMFQRV